MQTSWLPDPDTIPCLWYCTLFPCRWLFWWKARILWVFRRRHNKPCHLENLNCSTANRQAINTITGIPRIEENHKKNFSMKNSIDIKQPNIGADWCTGWSGQTNVEAVFVYIFFYVQKPPRRIGWIPSGDLQRSFYQKKMTYTPLTRYSIGR